MIMLAITPQGAAWVQCDRHNRAIQRTLGRLNKGDDRPIVAATPAPMIAELLEAYNRLACFSGQSFVFLVDEDGLPKAMPHNALASIICQTPLVGVGLLVLNSEEEAFLGFTRDQKGCLEAILGGSDLAIKPLDELFDENEINLNFDAIRVQ